MKCGFLAGFLVLIALGLISCSSSTTSTTNAGTGILYVTTQGDTSVAAFGINLNTGVISTNGNLTATGNMPSSIVLLPSGGTAFVTNAADDTVSTLPINSDGTVAAASGTTPTGQTPLGMAMDPGGKFLFVANQGTFTDPNSGSISVFAISGSTLAPAPGSPFSTFTPGVLSGTGPVSVAVGAKASFLYVANQFTNTVSGYTVDSTGVLTLIPGSPFSTGTAPSFVALTPDGNFLYVANQGSNNVSAFATCITASVSCVNQLSGALVEVKGSPFAAGLGPISMAVGSTSLGEYLYVADYNSNQLSQYKVGTGTGALTPASPPAVSTGANPVSVVIRTGSTTVLTDGGTTNYVYVANITAASISGFSYDTSIGTLTVDGAAVTTETQPSAIAVK